MDQINALYESRRTWKILRAPNTMGLFHGLPQRLEELVASRDKARMLAWEGVSGGGTLHLNHLNTATAGGAESTMGMRIPVLSADGRFEVIQLPPGTYTITASAFDYDTHVYQWGDNRARFTIPPSTNATVPVEIQLEARDLWYGRALFDDGTPVSSGTFTGLHQGRRW